MKWTQNISDEWWKNKKKNKWTFGLLTIEAVCWNQEMGRNNALELKINEMRNGTMNFSCAFWSWSVLVFSPFLFLFTWIVRVFVHVRTRFFVAVIVNLIPSNMLLSFLALNSVVRYDFFNCFFFHCRFDFSLLHNSAFVYNFRITLWI